MPSRIPPSPVQLEELGILIRAHHPLLLIESVEEDRVHSLLKHLAEKRGIPLFSWTQTDGLERELPTQGRTPETKTSRSCLAFIERADQPAIFHLRGFSEFVRDGANVVHLKQIYRQYFQHEGAVVISGSGVDLPPELEPLFTVVELGSPTPEAYRQFVTSVLRDVAKRLSITVDLSASDVSRLLNALHGLTFFEVQKIITQTLVEDGKLAAEHINRIVDAKRKSIERTGVLEYFPHDEQLADIAGMSKLKSWLQKRQAVFTEPTRAKDFGLTPPKGLLLIGVQGCGKSLCAKAIAAEWKLPLIRLDPSSLYQKYVGETEKNLRRAIKAAEDMAPIVLWIDEIEKALNQSDQDMGISTRVLGTFLTWMQEKKESVFVIATANDISRLPPELLRKGRFDEIFFVDLPVREVREKILGIHIKRRGRDPSDFDLAAMADAAEGFSGAELEQAVVSALYTAFSKNEELATDAILEEIKGTRPLSVTMAEKVDTLRAWASNRAVLAD